MSAEWVQLRYGQVFLPQWEIDLPNGGHLTVMETPKELVCSVRLRYQGRTWYDLVDVKNAYPVRTYHRQEAALRWASKLVHAFEKYTGEQDESEERAGGDVRSGDVGDGAERGDPLNRGVPV